MVGRKPIGRLLKAVEDRIAAGAEFEAGATGIKVGAAPKLAELTSVTARTETAVATRAEATGSAAQNKSSIAATLDLEPEPRSIYLVHTARRDRALDRAGTEYYRVRVYLDTDDPSMLDEVSGVTYYLHPTFQNPIRSTENRDMSFELRTVMWGEFNAAAVVRFKDGHQEKLERYLNL